MEKCYADTTLTVSKKEFDRPDNLSIKVDCWTPKAVDTTQQEQNTDEFAL
jgi:penicillin-binding protein 1A